MGRLEFSDGRVLGEREGAFIIAEAGVNHGGELDRAKALVEVAVEAGADAVKFQTFQTDKLVTEGAEKADYQKDQLDGAQTQREMLRELELAPGMHRELQAECEEHDILFLSTPFDTESADLLEQLGVPAFKVGSGELTNLPFLTHLAAKQQPMIVSSGMSDLGELEEAVCTIEDQGNRDIVLMHCVSNYPASPASTNLRAIDTISRAFGYPTGLSDHTMGIEIPIAAVARGAA
ncbi:MAG: N-acetylneuraminate synthase family protein, partial [Bradymonadaceae bacterium]